jgi:2-keto-3-deoxy-L-rhamnonate aldolase RhmA
MTEDKQGLAEIAEIAAVDGVDLIALGPTDISTVLGMTDPTDPRLKETFEELAAKVKAVGKAGVYIPVNHAACRFTPQDLLKMGVNYSSVAPAPPTIVLNALKASAKNIREEAAKAVKV